MSGCISPWVMNMLHHITTLLVMYNHKRCTKALSVFCVKLHSDLVQRGVAQRRRDVFHSH